MPEWFPKQMSCYRDEDSDDYLLQPFTAIREPQAPTQAEQDENLLVLRLAYLQRRYEEQMRDMVALQQVPPPIFVEIQSDLAIQRIEFPPRLPEALLDPIGQIIVEFERENIGRPRNESPIPHGYEPGLGQEPGIGETASRNLRLMLTLLDPG